jgi:hypothetical protein
MRRGTGALGVVGAALLLAGCVRSGTGAAPPSAPVPSATAPSVSPSVSPSGSLAPATEPPCPAKPTRPAWPSGVPATFPWPGGRVVAVDRSHPNILRVRLEVPRSLVESVRFVVRRLPAAGYPLGRGDAGAYEATAPFSRGDDLRGLVRMFRTEKECSSLWLVAFARPGPTSAPPS